MKHDDSPDNHTSNEQPPATRYPVVLALLPALCALAFLGSAFDHFQPVKNTLVHIACLGMLLAWISRIMLTRRLEWLNTGAGLPMALFLAWCTAALFFAPHDHYIVRELLKWGCGFFLFVFTLQFVADQRGVEKTLAAALAASLGVTLFAVLELRNINWFPWDYLIVNPWHSVFASYESVGYEPLRWADDFYGRVSSTIGNPVYLGGYVVLLIPPGAALFLAAKTRARRALAFAALCGLFFCLVATFTRSAWAVCILSLSLFGVLAAMWTPPGKRRALALRSLPLLLAAGVVIAVFSFKNPVNTSAFDAPRRAMKVPGAQDESFKERSMLWATTWDMIRDRPVTGFGPGHFFTAFPFFHKEYYNNAQGKWLPQILPTHAHNDALEICAETGFIGLALFLWIMLAVLWPVGIAHKSREPDRPEPRILAAGLFSGLAALLLYSNFQFPFHNPPSAVHFWIFAGLLHVTTKRVLRGDAPHTVRTFPGHTHARERILVAATLGLVFMITAHFLLKPLIGHVFFGRGVRLEIRMQPEHPDYVLELLEHGRSAYPYDAEMCHEMTVILLNRARELELPPQGILYYSEIARRYGWPTLWNGKLPPDVMDALPSTPPTGHIVPLKIAYYANVVRVGNQCIKDLNPNDARVIANLGRVFLDMQMPDRAASAYQQALSLYPLEAIWLYNLGIAYFETGNYDQAIKEFEKSIALSPDFAQAYFNMGRVYEARGRFEDALSAYGRALKRNPDSTLFLKAIGRLYFERGKKTGSREDYDRAEKYLLDSVDRDPNFLEAKGDLAILLYNRGKAGKAVRLFMDIINEAPEGSGLIPIAFYHLGEALLAQGKRSEAVSAIRRAELLNPGEPHYKKRRQEISEQNEPDQ